MDRQEKFVPISAVTSRHRYSDGDGGVSNLIEEGSQQGSTGGGGDDGRAGSDIQNGFQEGDKQTVTMTMTPLETVMAENQELKKSVEMQQSSLRDALGQLRKRERMLGYFRRRYPDFEPKVKRYRELLKMKKVLTKEELKLRQSIDQVVGEVQVKQDQLEELKRKVEKLKKADVKPSRRNAWNIMNDKRKDAVKILPEEMWAMVFAQVADTKDLWNCSNTCGLFKKILNKGFKKPTWEFMQAFPLLVQYLPRNGVLKCRSVSKGWNMVVDNFLESQLLRPQKPKKDVVFDYRLLPFANPIKEKKFDRLYKFDFRWKPFNINTPRFPYLPGRNPFIGKAITLIMGMATFNVNDIASGFIFACEEHSRRNEAYWNSIYSFLKTFGKYIWYLTLESGQVGCERQQFQRKTQRFLNADLPTLLPNLRKLRILPTKNENYDNLDNRLRPNQLSLAPTLETVEADGEHVNGSHLPLATFLVRQRRTLQVLHLSGDIWRSVYERKWPKLTELHLDHLVDKKDLELLAVGAGKKGMPLLRKLGVNLRGAPGSFDWLLDAIHALFGTTRLTTLRLHGGIRPGMFQKARWASCMSPTLKTLEVEHGSEPGFYEFLLHFPLVENVHVFGERAVESGGRLRIRDGDGRRHYPEEENKLEVDFHQLICQGKVYQSKIWELLPRLKLFTYGWDVYSRAGYKQVKIKVSSRQQLANCFEMLLDSFVASLASASPSPDQGRQGDITNSCITS